MQSPLEFVSSRDWHKMGKWKHTLFLESTVCSGVNNEEHGSSIPFNSSTYVCVNHSQYVPKKEFEENVSQTIDAIKREGARVATRLREGVEKRVHEMNSFSPSRLDASTLRKLSQMLFTHGRNWYEIMLCDGALSKLYPKSLPQKFFIGGSEFTPEGLLTKVALAKMLFPMIEEHSHLLQTAIDLKNGKEIEGELAAHSQKYGWMNSICWWDDPFGPEYYRRQVEEISKQNPEQQLQEKIEKREKQYALAEELLSSLKEKHGEAWMFVDMIRELTDLKEENWDAVSIAGTRLRPLFKKAASELHLSYNQFMELNCWEMTRFMEMSELPVSVDELNQRLKGYVDFCPRKQESIVIVGSQVQEIIKFVEKEPLPQMQELKGMPVWQGIVKAKVCRVNSSDEIGKMQEGQILVCPMSDPDYMPAIKKASAIVADQGGLLCHAAIVAREMQIPCVVGTEYATKILDDGDLVEVDAVNGVVRKI